ncbi:MAG: efp [Clostridia bacterium]|jgi:elongation factor P|nr:efp [Clostridia bacterium]
MILAGEFRNGVTFEMDSSVYRVVDFQHVKPGKGAAFVRTRLKNVITGNTLEKTFNPTEKVEEAQITIQEMQYLYNDGERYTFMDTTSFEQVELSKEQIEDTLPFLKDNMNFKVLSYKGNIFGIEPPTFVELEVTYTEPGIKGSTSTGTTKPATVETGAVFNVPIFIEIGNVIRIDTRTSQYMERA